VQFGNQTSFDHCNTRALQYSDDFTSVGLRLSQSQKMGTTRTGRKEKKFNFSVLKIFY
jgi:hypothetical protein